MTALAHHPHPVTAAVSSARAALSGVTGVPVWSMTGEQTKQTLVEVEALEAQLAAAKSRLLRHAESIDLPGESGARSSANWLARRHRLTRREAHRQLFLADALETHALVAAAMDQGRVNHEQAHAILRGLATLPEDLDPELVVRAEDHLIGLAKDFDATALKRLARTILEVVAPDVADEHLAKLMEKEERDAEAAARFAMWEDGHGQVHGTFTLDAFSGACLKKALFALAAPKHRAATGPLGERRPTPQRLGQAFADYVRRYPADKLPKAGGLNATVVALIPYDTLMGSLRAANLDTGETISAALARRIACEAGIIPAVLGGKSEVLDLGRSRRFHSRAQRIKATIEQGGCIEEGCDAPPAFTQMHHPEPFSTGGKTDGNGWMLCPSAHRRIHDPRYVQERLPNGRVRFHRRE